MASTLKQIITAAHWGPLTITTDGKQIIASGSALDPDTGNSLQEAVACQVHSPARIRHPMVRRGYLENPDNPQGVRGQDRYLRVSWDEALALIDRQHRRIRKQYGPAAIFAGSYGWRSVGILHKAATLLQRYMSLAGGYTGHIGDYSTGAAQFIMPHVVGCIEVYQQQTSWDQVLAHSETVVLWSANPLNTSKVAWNASDGQGLQFFQALKNSGKKIFCINPMRSETTDFFGEQAEWLAPNMGTDVALMLGIAYALWIAERHDTAFLASHCSGWPEFERYLSGQTDGVAKTPAWAAALCGVSADDIQRLASVFHKTRTLLMAGWGMQRQQYGEQTHWMLVTLAAMLGQIGLPGGGFGFAYHTTNGGNPVRRAVIPDSMRGCVAGGVGAVTTIPVARLVEALERPGALYQHNGRSHRFPDIRMIWWAGGNNFTHHQDTHRLIRAWQRPELVIISECYWTAAAKHADIVLPVTTSFERNDITMTGDYSLRHLVPMKQVVAPQYEARSDYDIFAALSQRWEAEGGARFNEGHNEMGWLMRFYEAARSRGAVKNITLPPFAAFWAANKIVEMPEEPRNRNFVRYADFRADPVRRPLSTPSGKIEIYSQTIADFGYADCPGHPTWLVPDEWYGNAAQDELQLLTSHPAHRLHSQLNYARLRERYAVAGREPVIIHPRDAAARGIADGDVVRLWNRRGQVLAGAQLSEGIRPGVVCLHEGGWPDLDATGLCHYGAVNVLTRDARTSRLGNGCAANSALVRLDKYTGPERPLRAFIPPPGVL